MAENNPLNVPLPNDADQGLHAAAVAAAAAEQLPAFWADEPEMWFASVEASFETLRVTSQRTRYTRVLARRPCETLVSIRDIVRAANTLADPYDQLRARLCHTFGKSKWQLINELIDHPPLGHEKPSVLMSKLMALLPDGCAPNDLFLGHFLRRLPEGMRERLGSQEFTTPAAMAAAADSMWAARGDSSVAAAAVQPAGQQNNNQRQDGGRNRGRSRSRRGGGGGGQGGGAQNRSPSRGGTNRYEQHLGSGKCWYHFTYKDKATRCQSPCNFRPQEN